MSEILKEGLVLPNTGHSEMEPEISLLWLTTLEAEVTQHFKGSSRCTWLHACFAYLIFMLRHFVTHFQIKEKEGEKISALWLYSSSLVICLAVLVW